MTTPCRCLRLEARAKEIGEALDVPIYIHSGYDLVDEIAEYDDFNAYVKESHFFDSVTALTTRASTS